MIVLTHRLYLKQATSEHAFDIRIHRPVKAPKVWTCRFEIDWPDGRQVRDAFGHDALQALVLALQMIGANLYASAYHAEGRLRAYPSEQGYGFPVASSLRDLLVGIDAI